MTGRARDIPSFLSPTISEGTESAVDRPLRPRSPSETDDHSRPTTPNSVLEYIPILPVSKKTSISEIIEFYFHKDKKIQNGHKFMNI